MLTTALAAHAQRGDVEAALDALQAGYNLIMYTIIDIGTVILYL
jgi:hypothetical protein